jgi:two-component system, chemotaxis family, chemotaxis protein CheY
MAYNILIVDDSDTMRAVLAKTLTLAGVAVGALHQAANGLQGMEILRKEWIDLVLADINMPVMNGVGMVGAMKADPALEGIPVIIISTEGSEARLQALKDGGVRAFLRKPFPPEELKKAVETVLGGSHG